VAKNKRPTRRDVAKLGRMMQQATTRHRHYGVYGANK
jgi:hypothetical protein